VTEGDDVLRRCHHHNYNAFVVHLLLIGALQMHYNYDDDNDEVHHRSSATVIGLQAVGLF